MHAECSPKTSQFITFTWRVRSYNVNAADIWLDVSASSELKPEPPSITFEPNIFTSGETVGLAWNALNNTGIHFYRVEVLTTCRSIFSDVSLNSIWFWLSATLRWQWLGILCSGTAKNHVPLGDYTKFVLSVCRSVCLPTRLPVCLSLFLSVDSHVTSCFYDLNIP